MRKTCVCSIREPNSCTLSISSTRRPWDSLPFEVFDQCSPEVSSHTYRWFHSYFFLSGSNVPRSFIMVPDRIIVVTEALTKLDCVLILDEKYVALLKQPKVINKHYKARTEEVPHRIIYGICELYRLDPRAHYHILKQQLDMSVHSLYISHAMIRHSSPIKAGQPAKSICSLKDYTP